MSAEHGHGHDAHESHGHGSHGPSVWREILDGLESVRKKVVDVLGLGKTPVSDHEKDLVEWYVDDTKGAHNKAARLLIELLESEDPEYINLALKFAHQHPLTKASSGVLRELEKLVKKQEMLSHLGGHGHDDGHGGGHGHDSHAHAA